METILNYSLENGNINESSVPFSYRRKVHEINSPRRWNKQCYGGKCPAFSNVRSNFYF